MLRFIHGTDRGNAVLVALILIIVLSTVFMSLVPRIITMKKFSAEYKANVIGNIDHSNKEIMSRYDLH